MAMNWYVVHTYSGFENKVKENLESTVRAEGLEEKICQILIPTEEVVEIRDGKKFNTENIPWIYYCRDGL